MALYGGLSVSLRGAGGPQELDVATIELFCQFFTLDELITTYRLKDLEVKDLTILKAAVAQTMATQIARGESLNTAVRERFIAVWNLIQPPTSS